MPNIKYLAVEQINIITDTNECLLLTKYFVYTTSCHAHICEVGILMRLLSQV